VVTALHELLLPLHERVVAQVVEAELVVCAVRDVGPVGRAALGRVRLVLIDAVDGQAVVLEDGPHPVGVALGQVRVHRDEVRAAAGQRVQVEGHDGDERLPFARLHLGDAALMQHDGPEELHIVRDHVPLDLGTAGRPRLAEHAAARLFHDGEGLGQQVVERLVDDDLPLVFEVVQLFVEHLALVERQRGLVALGRLPVAAYVDLLGRGRMAECVADLLLSRLIVRHRVLDGLAKGVRLAAQLVIGQILQLLVLLVDLVNDGPQLVELALVAVTEKVFEPIKHIFATCNDSVHGRPCRSSEAIWETSPGPLRLERYVVNVTQRLSIRSLHTTG